ncbi:MAG: hypothetical protein U0105_00310 [Candidatus Obscuribacterales bacterium]
MANNQAEGSDGIKESDIVAETKVIFIRASDGERLFVRLGIGRPFFIANDLCSYCYIFMDGHLKPLKVSGTDSLQALCLAVQFLRKQLETVRKMGWTILEDDPSSETAETFDIDACFGRK